MSLGVGLAFGLGAATAHAQSSYPAPYKIKTLAGSEVAFGFANGTGSAAQFRTPFGVAVDSLGNVYVADTLNYIIRMIAPGGIVTTFAGTPGNKSYADGTGPAAAFSSPTGVAVDSLGNVYVADSQNYDIRRITPGGVVSTLAGKTGIPGSIDAVGTTAEFFTPQSLAVDSSGNVYVADTGNDTIRKVTPITVSGVTTWAVTTPAGLANSSGSSDGTGSAARFNGPKGVAVDSAGNVYVADSGNSTIRKMTPTTVSGVTTWAVTTLAGEPTLLGHTDATGSAARFYYPCGIALDGAGNIYVADTDNDGIRLLAPDGTVTSLAGGGEAGSTDGIGSSALFFDPYSLAADSAGNIYVADTENGTIREGSLAAGPSIATQPASQTVNAGSDVLLTVVASENSTLSYQWTLNGGPINGATGSTLFLGNVQAGNAGAYQVEVTDASSNETTSKTATLTVVGAPASGRTGQPVSQTVNSGGTVVFTVATAGVGTTYQWQFNGSNLADGAGISGATGPQLMISGASTADAGDYSCIVTTGGVAAQGNSASLTVTSSSNPGIATSISTRAFVGTGDNILIGGFFIVGSTSRTVLVQGLGPALGQFGVTGFLAHPTLSIHQTQNGSDVTLYSNTGWGSSAVLLSAAASVFASPTLPANSPDSELLLTLPPGGYSAEVLGADGGSGVALCAIYELP